MELEYKEFEEEVAQQIDAFYPNKGSLIEVVPGNVIVPRSFQDMGESIRSLTVYPDDVWLVSYPRTGSTWAQEMVWLLGSRLDFEGAKRIQPLRVPIIELSALYSVDHNNWISENLGNTLNAVRNMDRPRFIRSHMPLALLPKDLIKSGAKIIYTARNPKDLCVSYYHYCKMMHGLTGSFEDFVDLFMKGRAPIGSYWKHCLPFWDLSKEPNIQFLKYEDMNRNLAEVVRKCAKFMNLPYEISEENMHKICNYLNFDNMRKNPAVNLEPLLSQVNEGGVGAAKAQNDDNSKFIRRGKIGDWREHMSQELSQRFDEWIDENTKGTTLEFEYE